MGGRGSQVHHCFHIDFFWVTGEIYQFVFLGRELRFVVNNLSEKKFIYLFQNFAIFSVDFLYAQQCTSSTIFLFKFSLGVSNPTVKLENNVDTGDFYQIPVSVVSTTFILNYY